MAPHSAGHRDRRPDRLRATGAHRRRRGVRARPPAVPHDVLPARLRRGLRGRVLLLHLVGGARRRHGGVVPGERRAAPGERGHLPRPAALPPRGGGAPGRPPPPPRPPRPPPPPPPPP